MKRNTNCPVLKEYLSNISNEDLDFIKMRLSQRLQDDIVEVTDFLSQDSEVDKWLNSAKSAWEFYDMIDLTENFCQKELEKRKK